MVAISLRLLVTSIWCLNACIVVHTNALGRTVNFADVNVSPPAEDVQTAQQLMPLYAPEVLEKDGPPPQEDNPVVQQSEQTVGPQSAQDEPVAPVESQQENPVVDANAQETGDDGVQSQDTPQVSVSPTGSAHETVGQEENAAPPIPTSPLPDEEVPAAEAAASSEGQNVEVSSNSMVSSKGNVPPPIGFIYDPKDMQKNGDATKLDIGDVLESGKDKMSKLTMGIDQDWLNKERAVESVQNKMPMGTGFGYNRSAKVLTPVMNQPKVMGGVLQTIIDKEAELRRRHAHGVQIEHDLRLRVTKETAVVVGLLTKGSMEELKRNHPLVFTRIVEPLKASIAVAQLNKTVDQITQAYDKNWYVKATPKDKQQLLNNIRRDTGRADLFVSKTKKPKNLSEKKQRVYDVLDEYYNDYQCQKVVRGNQVAKQMLRMFDERSGLYVAPFYTDVVPTLGSLWMIARFERFFKYSDSLRSDVLAKALPQMVGRFMAMVENGTVLPTTPELQVTLYSLSAVLSRIMSGVAEPRTFLGKKKYYGFMGLCDLKCAKGILTDLPGGNVKKTFVLNKQREILRWSSLYLRDDLLRIDTTVQRLLLELMFRTTSDQKYLLSSKNVEFRMTSEYVKEKPASMLEFPIPHSVIAPAKDKLDIMAKRFLSGYRQFGKRVDNKVGSNSIAPYNVFKTPNKVVASLDDGLLNMVEVVTDVVNINLSGEANNLYFQAFNTWVQLQTFHNAIHAFEPLSSKNKSSSKTMGAIFRYLNTNINGHIQSIPKQFLPYTSLVLQMSFYLQNAVEGYERTKTGAVKNLLRGLSTFSLRGKMGPRNFDQLYSYFQPHVIYNKAKYRIGRAIVGDMVKKFKGMFLAKPAIPAPIIQLITVFIGLWTKGRHPVLDLNNPDIDRVRKSFFLSYLSNRTGMAEVGTDIIMKHCGPVTKVLHLGCVSKYGTKITKCRQVSVKVKRSEVLKAMQLLDSTFDDPLDIIRVGSDTARRCMAISRRVGQPNDTSEIGPGHGDRLMVFSEIAQRYHCYTAQKMVTSQLLKALLMTKDRSTVDSVVSQVFGAMRTISTKQSDMKGDELKLVCPFMDDASQEMRESYRHRIVEYVKAKLTLRRKLAAGAKKLLKYLLLGKSIEPTNTTVLEEIPGCIMVGTRKYDGIMFYAGYAPPEKIQIPEGITLNPGDGRLVYDGKEFISELEALNASSAVTAITMEKKDGVTRRVYYLESGGTLDELRFGLEANDFIVKAHVLTTAGALGMMGYTIGRFIWCGYEHGWVADFALHDIIASADVPVFNGTYWLLGKLLRVSDVVGKNVSIKNGEQIRDKNIGDINVDVYSGDGNKIANYPSSVGDSSSFIKSGAETTFTFDTGYGEVSPAAIQDLIRNAEFDPASNTLVINLDAPGAVLQESPIITRS